MKICIDIGGTQTRIAQINQELEIFDLQVFQTATPNNTLNSIFEYLSDKNFQQINISTCGPIDVNSGVYGDVPNLKSWQNFNIRECIAQLYDCKVVIQNDANCGTLFEANLRTNINNLLYLTLSTGVGAGAIINGRLLTGVTNDAVSPYKYYINPTTTIDQACSGTGLLKEARKINRLIKNTKEIFEISNNHEIDLLIDQWTTEVALFLVNVYALFEVERIVLGGSVITNNEKYLLHISRKMRLMNCNVKLELTSEKEYNALKGAWLIDEFDKENDEKSTRNI